MQSGAPVAIVTGGSGGIGREAALALVSAGYRVYEFSRRGGTAPVFHITADVTDDAAVESAVAEVLDREGRIDLLIANAGFGISGPVELTPTAEAQRQLDVNLMGAARAVKAVLPAMREAGGGRIVLVSSVAAVIPIPFQAWYSVSKAAINTYARALRCEVRPFGITVAAVMPGDVATGFTASRHKLEGGPYAERVNAGVAVMEHDEQHGMSPAMVGGIIAKVAQKRRPAPLYTAGGKYKLFVFLLRLLPNRLVSYIIYKMYG